MKWSRDYSRAWLLVVNIPARLRELHHARKPEYDAMREQLRKMMEAKAKSNSSKGKGKM